MRTKIRGKGMNLLTFLGHTKIRNRIFRKASGRPMPQGPMNILAHQLHPHQQRWIIDSVINESETTRTYRLKIDSSGEVPAFFRAGQYLSFYLEIESSTLRRPFSISSWPDQIKTEGLCDITVQKTEQGFASRYILDTWKEGDRVESSGPAGEFYYQPLRDQKVLLCLGGGSGITPFRSMITDGLSHYPDLTILLFHGAVKENAFLFQDYFESLSEKYASRFHYIPVCSEGSDQWKGARGFLGAELMKEHIKSLLPGTSLTDCSFFLCGPPAMEQYVASELASEKIPRRLIRKENYALGTREPEDGLQRFSVLVRGNGHQQTVEARSDETLLVALERGGLKPPSLCRGGTCGWCRSRLVSGEVESADGESGLRQADKKFSHVHLCSVYPRTDLEIYIPEWPVYKKRKVL